MVAAVILEATVADAPALLALQRAAFASEAACYGDPGIRPLVETVADMAAAFTDHVVLKAELEGRIVGSARGRLEGGTCHIGRVVVEPELQGRGLGKLLMREIEARFPAAERYELFTGWKTERNIAFYEKLGYGVFNTERVNDRLSFVFMEKPGPGAGA